MYQDANLWIALIVAGVVGCIFAGIFASILAGIPIVLYVADIGKYIWAFIFAIPVPFILGFGQTGGAMFALAAAWLVFVPTIAAKFYFGPRDVPAMMLNAIHCGYAVGVLATYPIALTLLSHHA